MEKDTLFERIGGAAAVGAATELFYKKVLDDPLLKPFFEGVNMKRQLSKQKAFLTLAFGGPNRYKGKSLGEAHAKLVEQGLNDSHFDAVMGHLGGTLTELGVPEDLILEAAGIAESTRDEVLGGDAHDPMGDWVGWSKFKSCDGCAGYAILKDSKGSPRVMLPHDEDCSLG